jgi:pimeloyl-ACP methyl ester carboxylesterase
MGATEKRFGKALLFAGDKGGWGLSLNKMAGFLPATIMACALAAIAGCSPPALQSMRTPAGRVEVTPLKTYVAPESRALLWLAGVKGVTVETSIDCYRIVYPSTDADGKPIRLSGLLALPHGSPARGLVSYQHGTTSDRQFVPSNLNTEGLAAAIIFAGNGYAVVAPDYEGLGVSQRPHPYYVAADTARAVIDMIHAVRRIRGVPESPPFLFGFSEGGFADLAAHRALEAAGEPVLGDASVAGAFNLRAISLPFTLEGKSRNDSTYLALWVRGYAVRYGHALDTAFTPRYAQLVPQLFDTPRSVDDVVKSLPRNPREMFTPAALNALDGKGEHWLVDALEKNEVGNWKAKAPIRLYYATDDVDVTPLESITTARQMGARGSLVRAVNVGDGDHTAAILKAVPLVLDWLKTLPAAQAD